VKSSPSTPEPSVVLWLSGGVQGNSAHPTTHLLASSTLPIFALDQLCQVSWETKPRPGSGDGSEDLWNPWMFGDFSPHYPSRPALAREDWWRTDEGFEGPALSRSSIYCIFIVWILPSKKRGRAAREGVQSACVQEDLAQATVGSSPHSSQAEWSWPN
jgi:hypothetical protein